MKLFEVIEIGHVSHYIGEIEAETKEEAEKKGWEEALGDVSLCDQCTDNWEPDGDTELIVTELKR